jgi:hypothetical protein
MANTLNLCDDLPHLRALSPTVDVAHECCSLRVDPWSQKHVQPQRYESVLRTGHMDKIVQHWRTKTSDNGRIQFKSQPTFSKCFLCKCESDV